MEPVITKDKFYEKAIYDWIDVQILDRKAYLATRAFRHRKGFSGRVVHALKEDKNLRDKFNEGKLRLASCMGPCLSTKKVPKVCQICFNEKRMDGAMGEVNCEPTNTRHFGVIINAHIEKVKSGNPTIKIRPRREILDFWVLPDGTTRLKSEREMQQEKEAEEQRGRYEVPVDIEGSKTYFNHYGDWVEEKEHYDREILSLLKSLAFVVIFHYIVKVEETCDDLDARFKKIPEKYTDPYKEEWETIMTRLRSSSTQTAEPKEEETEKECSA